MTQVKLALVVSNEEYLKSFRKDMWKTYQSSKGKTKLSISEKRAKFVIENAITAMEKYDEQWWLSDDFATIAYFQINEKTLLVTFERFKEAVSAVLGREIFAETATDLLKYRQEVNKKIVI